MQVNASSLGRWLRSWIQPSGAIHGFHNHSVWGDNPYRYGDFTCGHSTFASPLLAALAHALKAQPDERGAEVLCRLVDFQCSARQSDGQFAHIGFQVGEMLKGGLIHNVVPCVALCRTARLAGEVLGPGRLESIRETVSGVLQSCERLYGTGASEWSTANQEYTRQWAKLEFDAAFGTDSSTSIRRDLLFLLEQFHICGQPDAESAGTLRSMGNPDVLEPAEYYGLMLFPLLEASQRYNDERFLSGARGIARHVMRSSWIDGNGQRRLHRLWQRIDGIWHKCDEPMLIGGAGVTLAALQRLHEISRDEEIASFLADMDATYAHYQHPCGFFLAASGWGSEPDVIPSSAWQSHDLFHLLARHGVPHDFWSEFFRVEERVAALLGHSLLWLETEEHWTLRGYASMHGLELAGRKDSAHFGVDIPAWISSNRELPSEWQMPDRPIFARTNKGVFQVGGRRDVCR